MGPSYDDDLEPDLRPAQHSRNLNQSDSVVSHANATHMYRPVNYITRSIVHEIVCELIEIWSKK